ncbi:DUF742 domain-containing protein [Streptomyces katsurahamanus]|uniref:DUF742 domain-containing protein n=1 Tax=Streptomyces katsurahamanus TaxID=2577098 RepID=UPI002B1EE265|nr:DUF742 domain-containing protein [Streptomyces katsurahamanus]
MLTGLTICPGESAAGPSGGAGPPLSDPGAPPGVRTEPGAQTDSGVRTEPAVRRDPRQPRAEARQEVRRPRHTPGAAPAPPVPGDLPAAQRTLLGTLDGGSLTVVETAAVLALPVSAVRVLAAHLIDLGLVSARPPIPYAAQPDLDLLERVADGLRALKL